MAPAMQIGPSGYMGGMLDPAVQSFLEQQRAQQAALTAQRLGQKHEQTLQTQKLQAAAQQQQAAQEHEWQMEQARAQFQAQQAQLERDYMTFHQRLVHDHQLKMAQFEQDARRSWYEMLKADIQAENEKNDRLRSEAAKLNELQSSLETLATLSQLRAGQYRTDKQAELDRLLNDITTEWSNKQTIIEGLRSSAQQLASTHLKSPEGDLSYWEKQNAIRPLSPSDFRAKVDEFISRMTEGVASMTTLDILLNTENANPMEIARGLIAADAAASYLTQLKTQLEASSNPQLRQAAPMIDGVLHEIRQLDTKARGYAPLQRATKEALNLLDNSGLVARLDEARRQHKLTTEQGLQELIQQEIQKIQGYELELGYVSPRDKRLLEDLAFQARKQVERQILMAGEGLLSPEDAAKIAEQAFSTLRFVQKEPQPAAAVDRKQRQALRAEQKAQQRRKQIELSEQRRALLEERRSKYRP